MILLFSQVLRWFIRRIDGWDQRRLLAGKPVRGFVLKNGARGYMSELEQASLSPSGERPSTAHPG